MPTRIGRPGGSSPIKTSGNGDAPAKPSKPAPTTGKGGTPTKPTKPTKPPKPQKPSKTSDKGGAPVQLPVNVGKGHSASAPTKPTAPTKPSKPIGKGSSAAKPKPRRAKPTTQTGGYDRVKNNGDVMDAMSNWSQGIAASTRKPRRR